MDCRLVDDYKHPSTLKEVPVDLGVDSPKGVQDKVVDFLDILSEEVAGIHMQVVEGILWVAVELGNLRAAEVAWARLVLRVEVGQLQVVVDHFVE